MKLGGFLLILFYFAIPAFIKIYPSVIVELVFLNKGMHSLAISVNYFLFFLCLCCEFYVHLCVKLMLISAHNAKQYVQNEGQC